MRKMDMDAVDASLSVLHTMAGFLLAGIGSFNLFGVDLASTLFHSAGIALSTAWVIGYAAMIGTTVTSDNETERCPYRTFCSLRAGPDVS